MWLYYICGVINLFVTFYYLWVDLKAQCVCVLEFVKLQII